MRVDDEAGTICVSLSEGGVWVCLWDAGRVVRYDADGAVTRVVVTPCSRPTSCCFGGAGAGGAGGAGGGGAFATTLFITSCSVVDRTREGWDPTADDGADSLAAAAAAAEEPLAGGVFAVEAGVPGVPVHKASF